MKRNIFILLFSIVIGVSLFYIRQKKDITIDKIEINQDSLGLMLLYKATSGENWSRIWDLNKPITSWGGVITDNYGRVTELHLRNNKLQGKLPKLDFSELKVLDLSKNNLEGDLPELTTLPDLKKISLSDNGFAGEIPDFSHLSNLESIELGGNALDYSNLEFNNRTPNKDSLALLMLYYSKNGASLCQISWDLTKPMAQWEGVSVNSEGRVTELILKDHKLQGQIPKLDLPELVVLDLSENNLEGNLSELGSLKKIKKLDLSSNKLSGEMIAFKFSSKLEYLDLSKNELNGQIPSFRLRELITLDLSSNNLEGKVPDFKKLPKLVHLDLSLNDLEGEIPDFQQLSQLEYLDLGVNSLGGVIPDFTNLPQLRTLMLNSSGVGGAVPDFSNLPKLETLALDYNGGLKSIPNFSKIPDLSYLGLEAVHLKTSEFDYLPKLKTIY